MRSSRAMVRSWCVRPRLAARERREDDQRLTEQDARAHEAREGSQKKVASALAMRSREASIGALAHRDTPPQRSAGCDRLVASRLGLDLLTIASAGLAPGHNS
mmetsp:Transcript_6701/g.16757  ORF Transcript_6701/g.16757 Transcript_6701/m.16757 type:complete len:103 (-) Transcript_6701:14-322(-)